MTYSIYPSKRVKGFSVESELFDPAHNERRLRHKNIPEEFGRLSSLLNQHPSLAYIPSLADNTLIVEAEKDKEMIV